MNRRRRPPPVQDRSQNWETGDGADTPKRGMRHVISAAGLPPSVAREGAGAKKSSSPSTSGRNFLRGRRAHPGPGQARWCPSGSGRRGDQPASSEGPHPRRRRAAHARPRRPPRSTTASTRERPFFGELVEFITGGPLVALAVDGPRAVEAVRTLIGVTDPVKSAPGCIRGDYALEIGENLVHGSDSPESAAREVELFFPEPLVTSRRVARRGRPGGSALRCASTS